MEQSTSTLAINRVMSTESFTNFNQVPEKKGIPAYLYPGNAYEIVTGLTSVRKDVPLVNFDEDTSYLEILGRALLDYAKNIPATSLHATQLNMNVQGMILRDHNDKWILAFNPIVVFESPETAEAVEGDPSFPGVTVKIRRPFKVRVRFRDLNGQVNTRMLEGGPARFFQHEFDRNQGKFFWMAADKFHRARAMKDWKQCERKLRTWTKTVA